MLFQSKQNRKQKISRQSVIQDRIAAGIVRKTIRLQQRGAAFLQRRTERLTGRLKKYLLIGFCLLSGGYSLYLIAECFVHPKSQAFLVTPISVSKHTGQAGNENIPPSIVATLEELQDINRFRWYMISLPHSPSGKTA